MQSFSVRDIERVLRLPRSTVRGLIDTGFVTPSRGARREYRFSFRDLIVLRAARTLIDARVPRRRIHRSLEDLRRRLPEDLPLSGLTISAIGDRVVVREGAGAFHPEDGQYVLGFDVRIQDGGIRVVDLPEPAAAQAPPAPNTSEDWFARALGLESTDPDAALAAYERALDLEPENVSAWINRGRLLHERGELAAARAEYDRALALHEEDALLLYNYAILLEDSGDQAGAVQRYQDALQVDPDFADCHFNLARLFEALDRPQHAIRHLGQYRRLVTDRPH